MFRAYSPVMGTTDKAVCFEKTKPFHAERPSLPMKAYEEENMKSSQRVCPGRRSRHMVKVLLTVLMVPLMLFACGGEGDSGNSGENGSGILTGYFVDSPVEGLSYVTDTQNGLSDSDGKFSYLKGEGIAFFVGGIFIGETSAKKIITPVDLVPDATDTVHPTVTNITRFLQTLDNDGDVRNGIQITKFAQANGHEDSVKFDQSVSDFENDPQVQYVIEELTSDNLVVPMNLVDFENACSHLEETLALDYDTCCGWANGAIVNSYVESITYKNTVRCKLPLDMLLVRGTHPVVTVLINNSIELDVLVDTGSNRTVLPEEIFGDSSEKAIFIDSLCFENGVCLNDVHIVTATSPYTQSRPGYYNGILGLDVLQYFDITIDYRDELIYFRDTQKGNYLGQERISYVLDDSDRPFANISIEGEPYDGVLLDTGSAYTRISEDMYLALDHKPEPIFRSISFTFNSSEIVEHILLDQYGVDGAYPGRIIVQVAGWPAVGGSFFRQYLTSFVFKDKTLKLMPYEDNGHIREVPIQRLGLQISMLDASKIVFLPENGVAWLAGLRNGDNILSINGMSSDFLGYFGVCALLMNTEISEYQLEIKTSEGDIRYIWLEVGRD